MNRYLAFACLAGAAFLAARADAVSIIHSNDVLGEVEPCGCRSNPLGGMVRKEGLLKSLVAESLIQLDAGDLLFATNPIPEILRDQAELQARFLLKAHVLTHLDAAVPGEKDFALGTKKYLALTRDSHVKFIAANLIRKSGGALLPPDILFEKRDPDGKGGKIMRVAVFGLVGDDLAWPKDLRATSPIAAARAEVTKWRKKADVVVALTHQGFERDEELARKVPGIDFIIGGHTQTFLQSPQKVAATFIFQSSFRNQYVGVIPLRKPFLSDSYKLVGLDAAYDPTAKSPSAVEPLVAEMKTAIADLNTKAETARTETASAVALKKDKFHTFPKCAECHLKQFDFWRKTPHANAFHALFAAGQAKNKECLSCHTVGLGDAQGFLDVNRLAEDADGKPLSPEDLESFLLAVHDTKNLRDEIKIGKSDSPRTLTARLNGIRRAWTPVQCENCHQSGRDHPFSTNYPKKVETNACLTCHTYERAPEWYASDKKPDAAIIEKKRALITCPAGEFDE